MGSTTRWGDDIDSDELPAPQIIGPDKNGIKTIIEYFIDEDGKKYMLTRKIKMKKVTNTVNKEVARRKQLKKFGNAADHSPGPNPSTTNFGEVVPLKLGVKIQNAPTQEEQSNSEEPKKKEKTIVCRICKGDHFTLKCPYKHLEGIANLSADKISENAQENAQPTQSAPSEPARPDKYIPPSLRGSDGTRSEAASKGASGSRDSELPTLRVSNLSSETHENDIKDLFSRFGVVNRVFLAKDKITRASKGYAFVTFYDQKEAEKALNKLNGHGYDNLILSVEWSKRD